MRRVCAPLAGNLKKDTSQENKKMQLIKMYELVNQINEKKEI